MENRTKTVFEQIGGMNAVNTAVDIFYEKVMNDPEVNHFFQGVNINTQAGRLKAFLAYAFGAPTRYTGKDMRTAHSHLVERGLNDSHFDAVAGHLVDTLVELDVPQELIDEVTKIAESTRDDVLSK